MTYVPMTKERWLATVREHESDLLDLIRDWHPVSRVKNHRATEFVSVDDDLVEIEKAKMPITAPSAEMACQTIRAKIIHEEGEQDDPSERFTKALADEDVAAINSLLSSAWFGVPESTGCWSIPGFGVACDLMDDLPEEMYAPAYEPGEREELARKYGADGGDENPENWSEGSEE